MLKDLNPQQLQAVTHKNGPLLIVAGAGTGKTTVITERVAWLVAENLAKTDEILALTFTDKAAGEMIERIDRLLPYGYTDLWVMTFHAFCEQILKQHGLDIGLPNDFKLLNTTDQWLLVRENLEKFNLDYYRPLGNPTKFIHALIKHFSRCKDEEIWPADYLKYAEELKLNSDLPASDLSSRAKQSKAEGSHNLDVKPTTEQTDLSEINRLTEIANAYHIYQQLLLENQSLDFGDLINYTLKIFRTRPNLLKKYQQKFKYILVDEFQDTNFAQYELIKLLAGQLANLTVVGDDDQSIYKFRGASVANIMQFKKDFPQSKEIYLTTNYRSTQNILDLAYNFIQLNNPDRLEIKLAANKNNLSKRLKAHEPGSGIIEHLHSFDSTGEVNLVIEKILSLKKTDPQSTWNDFAILIRANNQAEAFINGFKNAALPFNFVAAKGLYTKEIILDVLNYLKLLDNYHESPALWRILNLPLINLPPLTLIALNNLATRRAWSLYEACEKSALLTNLSAEDQRKINKIISLLSTHSLLARDHNVKIVTLKFLEDFGYQSYLLQKNNPANWVYLNQLLAKMDDFAQSFSDASIKNFTRLMDLEISSGEAGSLSKELAEGPEAIKIMTVHAAKGLEFKYVFIVNLVDKRFPAIERGDPIDLPDALVKEIITNPDTHLPEERRLFYVAMTRAKLGLFFTSAADYGGQRKKKLSRFLYEIGFSQNIIPSPDIIKEKNPVDFKTTPATDTVTKKTTPPPITQFSFSSLKAFATCPYQYYLAFIIKIPVRGKATFSYGKTMHSTLQKFFSLILQKNQSTQTDLFNAPPAAAPVIAPALPPLQELLNLYHQSWIDDWYDTKALKKQYYEQGQESLKKIYQQISAAPPQVFALEKGFHFKLGAYTLKGVMDRVDTLPNGQMEIIDYKTGAAKTEAQVEKDQLLIYQLAATESLGWSLAKLTFYYLDDNAPLSFLGTESEIDKMKTKILNLITDINRHDFIATPNKISCQYCDFRAICSYRE